MIVYVPNGNDPLFGSWIDIDGSPRVNPSAVRAIWRVRAQNKQTLGGIPLEQAREYAAQDIAGMLGLTERTVRDILVGLEKGERRRRRARRLGGD